MGFVCAARRGWPRSFGFWAADTRYRRGDIVVPTSHNGYYFIANNAAPRATGALSKSVEPTWPTSPDALVDDTGAANELLVWRAQPILPDSELYSTYRPGGTDNLLPGIDAFPSAPPDWPTQYQDVWDSTQSQWSNWLPWPPMGEFRSDIDVDSIYCDDGDAWGWWEEDGFGSDCYAPSYLLDVTISGESASGSEITTAITDFETASSLTVVWYHLAAPDQLVVRAS